MTTLVFFHGWGASGRVWERQAAAFGHRMPVLTPTVPVWEEAWFSEYLRGLDLQECLLVGWSLGGMLLLEALSRLTDPPPKRLVLVGVAPVFTRRPDYPWGQPLTVVRAMRRALTKKPTAGTGGVCRTVPGPGGGGVGLTGPGGVCGSGHCRDLGGRPRLFAATRP